LYNLDQDHLQNNVIFTNRQRKALIILSFIIIAVSLNIGLNYYDVMWWVSWYRIVHTHGISSLPSIYTLCEPPTCKAPYLPLAIIMFIASYALATLIPQTIRYIIIKIILVIIPAIIVFYILKKYRGIDIAILWLLSLPFLQIVLVLQFDVLISMFIMLSTLYLIINKEHYSALFNALAILIKPVAIILAPLHIFLLFIKKKYRECIKYLFVFMLTLLIFIIPFFIVAPNKFIENTIQFHSSRAPQDLSLWAILTIVEESNIADKLKFIDNLWLIPFSLCYLTLFTIIYKANKNQIDTNTLYGILTSAFPLLLFIMFNKIGNLNYLIWIVPVSFLTLKFKYIKRFYLLTSLLILLCSLPYAIILLLAPASAEELVFIVEDLSYWDAKALITQSINYYIIYVLSLLRIYITTPLINFLTPTEALKLFSFILLELNNLRKALLIIVTIVTQILFTTISLFYLTAITNNHKYQNKNICCGKVII